VEEEIVRVEEILSLEVENLTMQEAISQQFQADMETLLRYLMQPLQADTRTQLRGAAAF
jgi:hypothetical protein